MAEEEVEEKEAGEGEEAPPEEGENDGAGKKKMLIGGGFAGVVAAGVLAAMMAVPSKEVKKSFQGPFTLALFEELFNCNISEQGRTRYLQMKPQAVYFAYDPTYMDGRVGDELYIAQVQNTVFNIASTKGLDDIYGEVNIAIFMSEVRDGLDPVLFPVHIGSTKLPWDTDEASGLKPGMSSDQNTFRGRHDDHILHITAENEMRIDDGPSTTFEPGEYDVRVISAEGQVIFVDTSSMNEGFVGEVKVGVMGKVMRVLPVELLIQ